MRKVETIFILERILKHFRNALIQVKKKADQENVHQLRIEVKKLRSLLKMLIFIKGRKTSPTLKDPIRSTYTAAGEIRDAQLLCVRLKLAGVGEKYPSQIISRLEKKIKKKTKFISSIRKRKVIRKARKVFCKQMPDTISPGEITKFINYETDTANSIMASENPSVRDLHSLRKIVKEIILTYRLLNNFGPALRAKITWNLAAFRQMEMLGNQLGSLNDLVNLAINTKEKKRRNIYSPEKNKISALHKKWQADTSTLKEGILAQFKAPLVSPVS